MSLLRSLLRLRTNPGPERPSILRRLCQGGGMRPWFRRFSMEEWGVITVNNLFLLMSTAAIGSAAVDVTHIYAAREQLQVAADLGAHAALVNYKRGDTPSRARSDAVKAIQYGMPITVFGRVVANSEADILLGTYNVRRDRFTAFRPSTLARPETAARVNAAMVTTRQARSSRNPVSTFLFRIAGVGSVDVEAAAVVIAYSPGCLMNGFTAKKRVNITSNNQFFDDFCIHSNSHVELNSNNGFELGTVVSMPDPTKVVMPTSGWASNIGIRDALREGEYDFRILDRITTGNDLQVSVRTMNTIEQQRYAPWLKFGTLIDVNPAAGGSNGGGSGLTPAHFTGPSGSVYRITCTGNQGLRLRDGTYSNMIITTNCPVFLDGAVNLESMILSTTSTDPRSIDGSSGGGSAVRIGALDRDCKAGGEAILLTRGGMQIPAKLSMYGAQILALGDIEFSADFEGYGASIITAGEIVGKTNIEAYGCPTTGMENLMRADYFRLAR